MPSKNERAASAPPTDLARDLGAAADDLNTALLEAEAALASLRLGVGASTTLEVNEGTGAETLLYFGKDGAAWRLSIGFEHPSIDYIDGLHPVTTVSRRLRNQAVAALPLLMEALLRAAREEIAGTRAAATAAREFAASIRAQSKP